MKTSAVKIREILKKHLMPSTDQHGNWIDLVSHVNPVLLISDLDDSLRPVSGTDAGAGEDDGR